MDTLYRTVRYYQGDHANEITATDLTHEEAKARCNDPETMSSTAVSPEAIARTKQYGAWFEGFQAQ